MERSRDNALVRLVTTFEGKTLTVIWLRGVPHWIARQVGEALGYVDADRLGKMIRAEWSDELAEGLDFILITGEELAAIKAFLAPDVIAPNTPSLLLLTQQGVFAASMLSRQPKARELRRWLSAEVLPEIAATGSYEPAALARRAAVERAGVLVDLHVRGRLSEEDLFAEVVDEDLVRLPSTQLVPLLQRIRAQREERRSRQAMPPLPESAAGRRIYFWETLRQRRDLTYTEMARLIGISPATISGWCQNPANVGKKELRERAIKALDLTSEEMDLYNRWLRGQQRRRS